jgi:diguanylate cyclase (GGDEF)-like protein
MRLRWITVIGALTITTLFVLTMLAVSRKVLLENYVAIERAHAADDQQRLVRLLTAQTDTLDHIALDYGSWDRTYRFMHSPDSRYIRSEISADSFISYGVRLFMLVDNHGKVIVSKDYGTPARSLPSSDVLQLVALTKKLIAEPKRNFISGFFTLSDGPAMVVLRPILTTDNAGPPRGVLVLLRSIDHQAIAEWSSLAQLDFTIAALNNGFSPATDPAGPRLVPASVTISVASGMLSVDTALTDIAGQPTLRLHFYHPREITRAGQAATRLLLLLLTLLGLLFSLLNLWLIQRYVLSRVERLIWLTKQTEQEDGLNSRVEIAGSDELAQLGRHMNQMLDRLQNSQQKLLAVQERLRFEATHDSLTGIWNRAAALELMDRELARCDREDSSLAVIMFDADHFKKINDHFGHTTGDRALQAISAAITRNLRSFDLCARYGGEEFLVIAPGCDLDEAQQLASRILAHLRSTPITVPNHAFCVTLSAGVTVGTETAKSEDLIAVADRALYRAKENGRDRVEVEPIAGNKPVLPSRFGPEAIDRAV